MAKGSQRQRKIQVTDELLLGTNARMLKKNSSGGYDVIFPASENHAVLITTKTVSKEENGTHFILNTATAFVTTLPAVAVGLEYWFHIGATEPTTTHTVVTDSSANVIVGNLASPDLNAASDVATVTDADTISFVASKAVHGDFAHVWSDGTNWYLDGMCKAFDGMTTTQAS